MGQKTNPNILRVGLVKPNVFKHIEKKPKEEYLYNFESLQLKKFIFTFFKKNGLIIHNCKIQYAHEGFIKIFISYYPNNELNFNFFLKQNSINYSKIKYNSILTKKRLTLKSLDNILYNSKTSQILQKFFTSLYIFLNKRINICLIISQLNKKKLLNLKEIEILKKKIIKLKNYDSNKFYTKSLTDSFLFLQNVNSASVLATLIANELVKLKQHNFFLRFIKKVLVLLKLNSLSKIKGIKIQIKGRINGRPRSKQRTITIGKNIPILSIGTNVDYSEKVSYTSNGTLGVKVWTF